MRGPAPGSHCTQPACAWTERYESNLRQYAPHPIDAAVRGSRWPAPRFHRGSAPARPTGLRVANQRPVTGTVALLSGQLARGSAPEVQYCQHSDRPVGAKPACTAQHTLSYKKNGHVAQSAGRSTAGENYKRTCMLHPNTSRCSCKLFRTVRRTTAVAARRSSDCALTNRSAPGLTRLHGAFDERPELRS